MTKDIMCKAVVLDMNDKINAIRKEVEGTNDLRVIAEAYIRTSKVVLETADALDKLEADND